MRTLGFLCLTGYWFRKNSVIIFCIVIPGINWFWPRDSVVRAGCLGRAMCLGYCSFARSEVCLGSCWVRCGRGVLCYGSVGKSDLFYIYGIRMKK